MADVQSTETSQDFTDFIEHVSRNVKRKEGFLIGSLAELPMEYLLMRMEDICLDALQVSRDQCAVMAGDEPPRSFNGTVFQVEPANTHPGYARLRKPDCRSRGHTRYLSFDEITNIRSKKGLESYEEDILFDFLGMKNAGKQKGSTGQNLFGLNNIKLQIQVAVTCLSWPKEASDWKTRQRAYGWPEKDLLENVVNGGCHLVPFRGPSSSHESTVFRLSFACAEVALVYTWTPIQKHIYHVLRLIKGDVVRQLELHGHRNIVHAYHFKTLMLWACETKPPSFWDESRVKSAVGELLCEMIEFLVDRNCPNYFMPSVNLMSNLPEDLDVDAAIMPLLVFKEQGAARLLATIPIANPSSRSAIRISNKLMNLGGIGLRSVNSRAGYQRSRAMFYEEPTKTKFTYPMEFNSLFSGISAHLRLASSPHCSSSGDAKVVRSRQSDYDMAARTLEQAASAEIRTYTSRRISFGDALPELLGSIYFTDESNPEMSLIRSTNIPSYTRDMSCSNGDLSCDDTIPASQSNLSRHQESCMTRKTAEVGSEDDFAKISSVSPQPSEQAPCELGKQGATEGKALNPSLQLILNVTINFIVPGFELMFPKASSLVSAAYRANFFYSHCRDYQLALHVCDESLRRFRAIKVHSAGTYVHDLCSVVLTPKWMPIFDKHIQTVYGLVALSDYLNRNRRNSPRPEREAERRYSTASECRSAASPHYLSPLEFLDYIKIQCEARLLPFYENSCSRSSKRMFSSWCSMTCRSRFILIAASRINNERPVTQSWNYRAPPVWSTYSTHCLWNK